MTNEVPVMTAGPVKGMLMALAIETATALVAWALWELAHF